MHIFSGMDVMRSVYLLPRDARATILSADTSSWEYAHTVSVGDANGDGADDLLIGVPLDNTGGDEAGALYLAFGPFDGGMTLTETATHISGSEGARLGSATHLADLDGDGVGEVIVSSPNTAEVFGFFIDTLVE